MQKVIIDTNVIVSALISKGIPSKILTELVFERKIELQLSEEIFSEYVGVLISAFVGVFTYKTANLN